MVIQSVRSKNACAERNLRCRAETKERWAGGLSRSEAEVKTWTLASSLITTWSSASGYSSNSKACWWSTPKKAPRKIAILASLGQGLLMVPAPHQNKSGGEKTGQEAPERSSGGQSRRFGSVALGHARCTPVPCQQTGAIESQHVRSSCKCKRTEN